MPKVSVVIPTRNRPKYLERAIASVLAQTYQDIEIIIVDDGEHSFVQEVAEKSHDLRIRTIVHKRSPQMVGVVGGGAARNLGILESHGEYVAFLDDDDEWLPEKLEKQVLALDSATADVIAAFTGVTLYDESTGEKKFNFCPGIIGAANIFDRTIYRCFIWTSALMVRRSVLLEERFDPTFPKNQEWDLQLRLAKKGKFYGINEPLTKLNLLGDDEHIGGRGNIKNIASGYRRLLEKYKEDFTMHPNALARQSFLLAGLCREMGEFDEMRERMCVAWKARPLKFAYLSHYVLSLLGRSVYMLFFNALAKK